MLKRGYQGTYHKLSVKHLDRYVQEFAGRHNQRPLDTIDQMAAMARGMDGKRLTYRELIGRARRAIRGCSNCRRYYAAWSLAEVVQQAQSYDHQNRYYTDSR